MVENVYESLKKVLLSRLEKTAASDDLGRLLGQMYRRLTGYENKLANADDVISRVQSAPENSLVNKDEQLSKLMRDRERIADSINTLREQYEIKQLQYTTEQGQPWSEPELRRPPLQYKEEERAAPSPRQDGPMRKERRPEMWGSKSREDRKARERALSGEEPAMSVKVKEEVPLSVSKDAPSESKAPSGKGPMSFKEWREGVGKSHPAAMDLETETDFAVRNEKASELFGAYKQYLDSVTGQRSESLRPSHLDIVKPEELGEISASDIMSNLFSHILKITGAAESGGDSVSGQMVQYLYSVVQGAETDVPDFIAFSKRDWISHKGERLHGYAANKLVADDLNRVAKNLGSFLGDFGTRLEELPASPSDADRKRLANQLNTQLDSAAGSIVSSLVNNLEKMNKADVMHGRGEGARLAPGEEGFLEPKPEAKERYEPFIGGTSRMQELMGVDPQRPSGTPEDLGVLDTRRPTPSDLKMLSFEEWGRSGAGKDSVDAWRAGGGGADGLSALSDEYQAYVQKQKMLGRQMKEQQSGTGGQTRRRVAPLRRRRQRSKKRPGTEVQQEHGSIPAPIDLPDLETSKANDLLEKIAVRRRHRRHLMKHKMEGRPVVRDIAPETPLDDPEAFKGERATTPSDEVMEGMHEGARLMREQLGERSDLVTDDLYKTREELMDLYEIVKNQHRHAKRQHKAGDISDVKFGKYEALLNNLKSDIKNVEMKIKDAERFMQEEGTYSDPLGGQSDRISPVDPRFTPSRSRKMHSQT